MYTIYARQSIGLSNQIKSNQNIKFTIEMQEALISTTVILDQCNDDPDRYCWTCNGLIDCSRTRIKAHQEIYDLFSDDKEQSTILRFSFVLIYY